jgi:haloalkane dehalogenase
MARSEQEIYSGLPQRDLEVGGHRIHLVDAGEGPTVLMVHGSPVSSFTFRRQIDLLRRRFRVVAPDLLGFGFSSAPDGGAGFRPQAEALRGVMDKLGLDDVRLVIHDWGGPIGLACMAERPEQLRQIVLINTSILPDFRPPPYWRAFIAPHLGEFLLVRLNVFAHGLPLLLAAARRPEIRRVYARSFERVAARRTVLALERLEGFRELMERVCTRLDAMRVPTLFLWGHPDPYFRKSELDRMRGLFQGSELHRIPGGGHFPQEDAPGPITEALSRFLV